LDYVVWRLSKPASAERGPATPERRQQADLDEKETHPRE